MAVIIASCFCHCRKKKTEKEKTKKCVMQKKKNKTHSRSWKNETVFAFGNIADSRFPVNGRVELFFSPGPDRLHGEYNLSSVIRLNSHGFVSEEQMMVNSTNPDWRES